MVTTAMATGVAESANKPTVADHPGNKGQQDHKARRERKAIWGQ